MSNIRYPSKFPTKQSSNFSHHFYQPQDIKIDLDQMSLKEKELMQQLECIDISLDLHGKQKEQKNHSDQEVDSKDHYQNGEQLLEQWHKKYSNEQHILMTEDQNLQQKVQLKAKQKQISSKLNRQKIIPKPPRQLKKTAVSKSTEQFHPKGKKPLLKDEQILHIKSTNQYVQPEIIEQSSYRQKSSFKVLNLTKQSHKKSLQHEMQCTFKPVILRKSIEMAKNMKPSFQRLTTQPNNYNPKKCPYQQKLIRKFSHSRINRLSQPRKQSTQKPEQQQMPSFTPTILKKQVIVTNNGLDIADRNKIWLEQKQAKIQKIREEEKKQKQKTQKFTYKPKIKQYSGQTDPRLSKFGMQGMAQYFSRLAAKNKGNTTDRNDMTQRKSICIQKQNNTLCINSSSSYKKKEVSSKNAKQKTSYQQALKVLHRKILDLKI